jgi:hypothetical protein
MTLIPWPWRLLALALLCAALTGWGWVKGAAHVQDRWDRSIFAQSLSLAAVEQRQARATIRVITDYVDRVRIVREAGESILKEAPVYVPSTTVCDLPGGFRLLHDAAVRGDSLPAASGDIDAPPASAQDLAAAVADNYTTYHAVARQLEALQTWIGQQRLATLKGVSPD